MVDSIKVESLFKEEEVEGAAEILGFSGTTERKIRIWYSVKVNTTCCLTLLHKDEVNEWTGEKIALCIFSVY